MKKQYGSLESLLEDAAARCSFESQQQQKRQGPAQQPQQKQQAPIRTAGCREMATRAHTFMLSTRVLVSWSFLRPLTSLSRAWRNCSLGRRETVRVSRKAGQGAVGASPWWEGRGHERWACWGQQERVWCGRMHVWRRMVHASGGLRHMQVNGRCQTAGRKLIIPIYPGGITSWC